MIDQDIDKYICPMKHIHLENYRRLLCSNRHIQKYMVYSVYVVPPHSMSDFDKFVYIEEHIRYRLDFLMHNVLLRGNRKYIIIRIAVTYHNWLLIAMESECPVPDTLPHMLPKLDIERFGRVPNRHRLNKLHRNISDRPNQYKGKR